MKILVVDDSTVMRRIVANMLTSFGFDPIEAKNGMDATRKILDEKPDLVITDWNMPEKNGEDLARWIRTNEQFKKLPIIMVTVSNNNEEIARKMRFLVNDVINKPFPPQKLLSKIEAIICESNKSSVSIR